MLHDEGLHRHTVLRRFLERGHVADAGERHVQRARDGRGREREHVDRAAHLLDVLLVCHAEALLLVHDEQAEVFEFHRLLQQLVRADDEVAFAGFQVCKRFSHLRGGTEPREHLNFDGKAKKALHRRLIMLLREHRRRH